MIDSINIHNLRGLEETSLALGPSVNLWVGDNGAGKTSILEAAAILSLGRSFVTPRAKSAIALGADALTVFGRVSQNDERHRLAVQISSSEDRRLRFNGRVAKGQAALNRVLPVLVIAPHGPDLIVGSPSDRRRFLDWGAFHWSGGDSRVFNALSRVLIQRNAGLRSGILSEGELEAWDHQIVGLGEAVDSWRRAFVDAVVPRFSSLLGSLGLGIELRIEYKNGWGTSSLGVALTNNRERDRRGKLSHVGPHRADLIVYRGEARATETLSRGQLKIANLALVLAQLKAATDREKSPVLCMDDPGAELDSKNLSSVWDVVLGMGCQVLATGMTHQRAGLELGRVKDAKVFHVKRGKVELKG